MRNKDLMPGLAQKTNSNFFPFPLLQPPQFSRRDERDWKRVYHIVNAEIDKRVDFASERFTCKGVHVSSGIGIIKRDASIFVIKQNSQNHRLCLHLNCNTCRIHGNVLALSVQKYRPEAIGWRDKCWSLPLNNFTGHPYVVAMLVRDRNLPIISTRRETIFAQHGQKNVKASWIVRNSVFCSSEGHCCVPCRKFQPLICSVRIEENLILRGSKSQELNWLISFV